MSKKNTAWLIISFLTVLTAFIWLGITVYNTLNKPTIPKDLEVISKPLDSRLDIDALESLKTRSYSE